MRDQNEDGTKCPLTPLSYPSLHTHRPAVDAETFAHDVYHQAYCVKPKYQAEYIPVEAGCSH